MMWFLFFGIVNIGTAAIFIISRNGKWALEIAFLALCLLFFAAALAFGGLQ